MSKMIIKTYRYLLFSKCYNCLLLQNPLSQKVFTKKFHNTNNINAKMYMENENKYAYNIMQNYGYQIAFSVNGKHSQSVTKDHFSNIMEKNWSKEGPHDIFKLFSSLSEYCGQNNICISGKQFDNYIDALTDSIQFATDEELKSIFYALAKWPETESIKTRNYIEVWASLDDECLKRINNWSYDEMFAFISLFYMLNVTRVSDFTRKCLLKLTGKAKKLTKSQVVQTLFFIGVVRKSPPDIHNLEVYVEDNFLQFTVDELAIIAMGLFKSKTPIRSTTLLSRIIGKIINNSSQIHEVSLASLLKIIRYSMKKSEDNEIYELLDSLHHQISRLSIMCNVQMALVGTSTLTLHEECLTKIANATLKSISTTRLKDLERLVLTYGTFNFLPKTELCFFSKILEELRKPERAHEIKEHGRSFSCCVAYLGLLDIHPFDLMNKILCPDFLLNTYGKHCHQYGREILTIHNIAKIFANGEVVNFLKDNQVVILSKKYTDYVPDENYKKQYNVSERMFLDVIKFVREIRGGEQFATGHHILSHYQRGGTFLKRIKNLEVCLC